MVDDIQKNLIKKELIFGPDNYKPLPVVLSKAKGVWAWDVNDKKYLDMMSGYSAVSHGHAHPELIKVLHRQSELLGITSRAFYTNTLGPFLQKLLDITESYTRFDRSNTVKQVKQVTFCTVQLFYSVLCCLQKQRILVLPFSAKN